MKYTLELDSKEAATVISLITLGRYVLDQQQIAEVVFTTSAPPGIRGCLVALSGCKTYEEMDALPEEEVVKRLQDQVRHVMAIIQTFTRTYIDQEFPSG